MRNSFLLILIIVLAAFLRFWDLPNNPPGLTWDGVALGYNAYSLLQTGKDEYGNFLPVNLKSFGDYKPALYSYLDIPFVAIFGLNELAVRLPAATFGVLSVLVLYFLANELFKNKKLALLAAFFLAILPWHIQFTRPAYEAGVALFFNILGVYFFIKSLHNKKLLLLSTIAFSLSFLTYQSSKLFVPLLVLSLLAIFRKKIHLDKYIYISIIIFSIFLTISLSPIIFQGEGKRLSTLNFFAYQRSSDEINTIAKENGVSQDNLGFQMLHGEWWTYFRGLFERYLIYFSPKMLFIDGDYNQRQRVPDLGVLYYFSFILIPLGIIYFLKKEDNKKLLFIWLLIAPIPAVLSRDLISSLRALNMVIPLVILEAAGFLTIINWLGKFNRNIFFLSLTIIILVFGYNFSIYLDRYFIHAPWEYSKYWLSGYKPMINDLTKVQNKYQKIVISDTWGQPYIYYLFYSKYPPANFQKQAVLDQPSVDVGTVRKIDNIEFRHIYWPNDRNEKNTLFVGPPDELPDKDLVGFNILSESKFLNGEIAFRMVGIEL